MIINDDLTGMVQMFAVVCSGLIVGVIALFITHGTIANATDYASYGVAYCFMMFIFAFVIGACCTLLVVQVVNSIISTIFVCFATHPDELAAFPEGKLLHDNLKERMAQLGEA